MNKFLASLEITFRRDPTNYRPRVNKLNSIKDREQKGKLFTILSDCSLYQRLVSQPPGITSSWKNHHESLRHWRL